MLLWMGLFSFLDVLLLVYRNTTVFWMFISYTVTLPNLLISSRSYRVVSLGLSIYEIISTETKDNFTSIFPIWMYFISFSCLIALIMIPGTMLNRNVNSRDACLDPDLRSTKIIQRNNQLFFDSLTMSYLKKDIKKITPLTTASKPIK